MPTGHLLGLYPRIPLTNMDLWRLSQATMVCQGLWSVLTSMYLISPAVVHSATLSLSLPLFVARFLADHPNGAIATYDFTVPTKLFYRRAYFHWLNP